MFTSLHSALGIFLFPFPALAQNLVVPVLNDQISDRVELTSTSTITIELTDYFGTELILDDMVRLEGNYEDDDDNLVTANLDFLLFSERTPITRDNFLGYSDRGDYLTSIVHRSISGFVIQGGGFTITQDQTGLVLDNVPTQATIVNEFGVSNTEGTISMAKLGGDPDSATSQWFVSLGANSDNLDNQNGGFTVFGRISQSTFSNAQLLDPATANTPFRNNNFGGALTSTPLHQSAFGNPPPPLTLGDFFRIASTTRVPVPPTEAGSSTTLSYEAQILNSQGSFSTSIAGSSLNIDLSGGRGNSVTLQTTATDSVGNQVSDTFSISIAIDYEIWRSQVFTPEQQSDGLISDPLADANGDGRTNLQAFTQGIDPFEKITSDFINISPDPENNRVLLSFRSTNDITGVDFFVEESHDLETWTRVTDFVESFGIAVPTGRQIFVPTDTLDENDQLITAPTTFYRLAFVLAP